MTDYIDSPDARTSLEMLERQILDILAVLTPTEIGQPNGYHELADIVDYLPRSGLQKVHRLLGYMELAAANLGLALMHIGDIGPIDLDPTLHRLAKDMGAGGEPQQTITGVLNLTAAAIGASPGTPTVAGIEAMWDTALETYRKRQGEPDE